MDDEQSRIHREEETILEDGGEAKRLITNDVCAICLEPLQSSDLPQVLECSHVFHRHCILHLRIYSGAECCPICRRRLPELRSMKAVLAGTVKLLASFNSRSRNSSLGPKRKHRWINKAKHLVQEIKYFAPQIASQVLDCLASLMYEMGDIAGAIDQVKYALTLFPRNGLLRLKFGDLLYGEGDVRGAITEYRIAGLFHPRRFENRFYHHIAERLYQCGDTGSAIFHWRRALAIDPGDTNAHLPLAEALYDSGDLDGAIREYQSILNYCPRNACAHCNLGMALFDKGDVEGAIDEYSLAIKYYPGYSSAHANLGNAYYSKGDLHNAIKKYRAALRIDPYDGDVSCNLGDALYEKGDLESAIRVYRNAVSRSPHHVFARCKLANAIYYNGDLECAISEYRAVLQIDPEHEEITQGCDKAVTILGYSYA